MTAKRTLVLLTCLLALGATGCSNKGSAVVEADTEGVWVDAGPLDYHIEGSRQLNPAEVPYDRYLAGLPAGYKQPTGSETWFGVFLRIENRTDKAEPTADDFEIEDTLGNVYKPIELDGKVNAFSYTAQTLEADGVMPHPDSSQAFDSTDGAMLLFKLPLSGYQNRPLEFKIHPPAGSKEPEDATIDLDV